MAAIEDNRSIESAMTGAATAAARAHSLGSVDQSTSTFRVSIVSMTGSTIIIDDASATDTISSVKERVFAANRKLPVQRQRLVYRSGPRDIEPLDDDETLDDVGVAQDGSAELDVLLADLTAAEAAAMGPLLLETAKGGLADAMREVLDEGAYIEIQDVDDTRR